MLKHTVAALIAAVALHWGVIARAQDNSEAPDFEKRVLKGEEDGQLPYRLLKPAGDAAEKRPLLVFLHGAGERGDDNQKQLAWGREFMRAAAKQGCIVVVPQCPTGQWWAPIRRRNGPEADGEAPQGQTQKLLVALIESLEKELPVDSGRLYITGLSMGGFGTWDLIQRYPEKFAAAVPVCGGGVPARAERMKGTPTWAFHGDKDEAVPVARSREIVEAVKKAGGEVKYTEYPGVKHDSWVKAYAEPELLKWMLAQKRAAK